MEFSAKQIASFIQGEIVGDENAMVHTFAKIEEGVPGALSFLSNPKYTPYIYETQASIVLVNRDFVPEQEVKATMIKVDNAYESLAKLLTLYEQSKPKHSGIHSLAFVAPSAKIGKICRRFSNFAANGSSFWVDSKMLSKIKRVMFNFVDLPFFINEMTIHKIKNPIKTLISISLRYLVLCFQKIN